MTETIIAHVDLDAFFAAVEQRDNPALRGRPVIVGADPKAGQGRGVVSTCSYEARRYGIHSAMPISEAYRRCPHGAFLPVNGSLYRDVSQQVFRIFHDFTPQVEPISIDEAFLDITGSAHLFGGPLGLARCLRGRIRDEIGLTASVGIAPVKMAAKIASEHCKPDGLLKVDRSGVKTFLECLPVGKLWGVGPKTEEALVKAGIRTVGNIASCDPGWLEERFGENGCHLYQLSHGIDPRAVETDEEIKSVSHEYTFERDTADTALIHDVLLKMCEKVSRRMRQYGLKGRTVTVKIRLKGFKTYTRAVSLPQKTNFADVLYQEAAAIFDAFPRRQQPVRLIGVRMSNFDDQYVQESLFTDVNFERMERLHRVMDAIKDKFGESAIHRAYASKER